METSKKDKVLASCDKIRRMLKKTEPFIWSGKLSDPVIRKRVTLYLRKTKRVSRATLRAVNKKN